MSINLFKKRVIWAAFLTPSETLSREKFEMVPAKEKPSKFLNKLLIFLI
tara:strand:+ start:362 stop:508 length:147 start_codon:yes stop_codon:yes gene_type:complete